MERHVEASVPSRGDPLTRFVSLVKGRIDRQVGDAIERLVDAGAPGATICPSTVARALAGNDGPWRALMPEVREAAADLAAQGRVQVTRRGAVVDARSPGGPIRLGRPVPPAIESRGATEP